MPNSIRPRPGMAAAALAVAALLGVAAPVRAQVVLSEGFGTTTYQFPAGWVRVNNSQFANTNFDDGGWGDPGTPLIFPAQAGGPPTYVAVSFASSLGTNPAVVSNWLITPALTLSPTSVFSFFTRTETGNIFGDRMQVWLSPTGGTNVGPNPIVGAPNITAGDQIPQPNTNSDFTIKLFDINPNELANNPAVVYPEAWTQFSVTLGSVAGVPAGPFTGRIGFRYYAEDGGEGATPRPVNFNQPFTDIIGVDSVTVVNAVPEPGALALLIGVGVPAFVRFVRRRGR
jgi:hypothetical protein